MSISVYAQILWLSLSGCLWMLSWRLFVDLALSYKSFRGCCWLTLLTAVCGRCLCRSSLQSKTLHRSSSSRSQEDCSSRDFVLAGFQAVMSEPSDDVPFRVQLRENIPHSELVFPKRTDLDHGPLLGSYFAITPANRWSKAERLKAYQGMCRIQLHSQCVF